MGAQADLPPVLDGTELLRGPLLREGEPRDAPEWPFCSSRGFLVVLFFAASWCDDCDDFLPKMRAFYEALNPTSLEAGAERDGRELEVIHVSSDYGPEEQLSYMKRHAGWLGLPLKSASAGGKEMDLTMHLKRHYRICAKKEMEAVGISDRLGGIPSVVVLRKDCNSQSLHCLTIDGKADIESDLIHPKSVVEAWHRLG